MNTLSLVSSSFRVKSSLEVVALILRLPPRAESPGSNTSVEKTPNNLLNLQTPQKETDQPITRPSSPLNDPNFKPHLLDSRRRRRTSCMLQRCGKPSQIYQEGRPAEVAELLSAMGARQTVVFEPSVLDTNHVDTLQLHPSCPTHSQHVFETADQTPNT
ncbi:unnamed protein product [Caenorhabditis auriculariae]|uniref:Uncharacterized protein n=1 Tax=Caenorhabditis auriculariae TaxID=2777116 RepID=A0A8S1H7U9_9PELO|nr:unnamed protein product [Caenorhabditis auriculariae]